MRFKGFLQETGLEVCLGANLFMVLLILFCKEKRTDSGSCYEHEGVNCGENRRGDYAVDEPGCDDSEVADDV